MIQIDMDMPKNCGECAFSWVNHYFSSEPPLMCNLVWCQNGLDGTKKHKDCPLRELEAEGGKYLK